MKKIAIGIDFSKKTFDATIRGRVEDDFIEVAYAKFDNDEKGFKAFVSWVRKSVRSFPEGKGRSSWIFCGDNTVICSAELSDYLATKGFDMWLESALQIRQSSGIIRTKNDRVDSRRIADYALKNYSGKVRLHEPDTKAYRKLRAIFTLHTMLVKDKVAKINQIKSGVLDVAPEALRISEAQLEMIERQLKEVDRQLESMLQDTEEFSENYRLMKSIKGVGPITACCFIIKTHNFKYMNDSRSFGNFAGVVPSHTEQSGTSVDKPDRVSRYRDKVTNAVLTSAVTSALKHNNPAIRDYFDRLLARGVHRNKAKNNCKFKLINIIMSMIRTRTVFDMEKYGKAKDKWPKAV